jgi:hypothetical protein
MIFRSNGEPGMGHEEAFAKAFIATDKQARWILFLSNPKRRSEILERLNHNLPFNPALGAEVHGNQYYPAGLEQLLKAMGAGPVCQVIADSMKIDGQELPLSVALSEIGSHGFGAVLSCVPGRLAYYKPESPGRGIILQVRS